MKEFTNLFVEQTPKTPQVDLNQYNGELILYGKSIPENAAKVYEPILKWVSQYILNADPQRISGSIWSISTLPLQYGLLKYLKSYTD